MTVTPDRTVLSPYRGPPCVRPPKAVVIHSTRSGQMSGQTVRWSDALARRDFIYAVVLLALVNRLEWFLWACAVGVNVYALVLLALFLLTV